MKHRRKFKSEQVVAPQMAQQLKTKNLNVVVGKLFYRQREANILRPTVLMIKIKFNMLQILTMNSLNVKHQGKSFNQLAFHLSAYMHL